jgi:hypothetical protein
MSRKYKFKNSEGVYFVSFSVVYWIDALTRSEYKDILVKNPPLARICNPCLRKIEKKHRSQTCTSGAGDNGMLDILVIESWFGQKY